MHCAKEPRSKTSGSAKHRAHKRRVPGETRTHILGLVFFITPL